MGKGPSSPQDVRSPQPSSPAASQHFGPGVAPVLAARLAPQLPGEEDAAAGFSSSSHEESKLAGLWLKS